LKNRSIDRDQSIPAARLGGRLPRFLDFTIGYALGETSFLQKLKEVTTQFLDGFDGVILTANQLVEAGDLVGKDIWVRDDETKAFLPEHLGQITPVATRLALCDWVREGAVGVVGTLLLGNSPSEEADNIQMISALRLQSRLVGLPMAIDLHILAGKNNGDIGKVIELGLNLAVELDGDLAIIPGGPNRASKKNIHQISVIPVFCRLAATENLNMDRLDDEGLASTPDITGIVFTDLNRNIWQAKTDQLSERESNRIKAGGR
jgi:hypothetical protein